MKRNHEGVFVVELQSAKGRTVVVAALIPIQVGLEGRTAGNEIRVLVAEAARLRIVIEGRTMARTRGRANS